jgi:hypothetical protein
LNFEVVEGQKNPVATQFFAVEQKESSRLPLMLHLE